MSEYLNESNFLSDFDRALRHEYGMGTEENRAVFHEARKGQGKTVDAPKMSGMWGAYRTPQVLNKLRGGKGDDAYNKARTKAKAEIYTRTAGEKLGTLLGTLGADLTQDSARRFWWLVNAAQATGEIGAESVLSKSNPELIRRSTYR